MAILRSGHPLRVETRLSDYHLGNTDAEHERLIRQAARLAPVTEQFFREAGIELGQRVLDVGSGVGDVAMLVSRLVGPTGEVVGIERDSRTIKRARERVAQAGIANLHFVQIDIDDFVCDSLFDAVVGRYILQFLPDPVAVVSSLSTCVRPGGIVAFQEGSWAPFLALSSNLPLYAASVALLQEAAERAGVDHEAGMALRKIYEDAGLPTPAMRLVMELGSEPEFTRWVADALASVLPAIKRQNLSLEAIGNIETLAQRLQDEVTRARAVAPWIGLVGAWSRLPIG
jgi:ubiquinone/menaquinone biosynthesis C-methylase UbiE